MWPDNPTYLTDQHNVVLTVFYGAVAAVSRYFTDSNDAGIVVLAALQWLFAAFCCSATANRFFNLPWRRLGVGAFDFSHPERHDCWNMRDYTHPEAGVVVRPSRLRAGAKTRFVILLFFMVCPLAVFATISLTKSPLFAFAFVWWFGVWYELRIPHQHGCHHRWRPDRKPGHPTAADRARRQIQSKRHSGGRSEKARTHLQPRPNGRSVLLAGRRPGEILRHPIEKSQLQVAYRHRRRHEELQRGMA